MTWWSVESKLKLFEVFVNKYFYVFSKIDVSVKYSKFSFLLDNTSLIYGNFIFKIEWTEFLLCAIKTLIYLYVLCIFLLDAMSMATLSDLVVATFYLWPGHKEVPRLASSHGVTVANCFIEWGDLIASGSCTSLLKRKLKHKFGVHPLNMVGWDRVSLPPLWFQKWRRQVFLKLEKKLVKRSFDELLSHIQDSIVTNWL